MAYFSRSADQRTLRSEPYVVVWERNEIHYILVWLSQFVVQRLLSFILAISFTLNGLNTCQSVSKSIVYQCITDSAFIRDRSVDCRPRKKQLRSCIQLFSVLLS